MNRQPESIMTWSRYREIMVSPERIKSGKIFIDLYREELRRAEDIYGVPAEIIASIIGIETRYGKVQGNIRVLDWSPGSIIYFYTSRKQPLHRVLVRTDKNYFVARVAHPDRVDESIAPLISSSYVVITVNESGSQESAHSNFVARYRSIVINTL